MAHSPTITVMLKAARKAARGLIRDFGEVGHLQVSRKGPADFVSSADLRAEQILIAELQTVRPGYGMLLEEQGEIAGDDKEYRFIVDPLDGTTNFLHGNPFFCIAIALEKTLPGGKREIIAAVVEAPALQETFWAEKGAGAWVERGADSISREGRLRVSARKTLLESMLFTGGFEAGGECHREQVSTLLAHGMIARCFGSSALSLAYLAAGRTDLFVQSGEKPWDIAAGILLVKEAGGIVTEINGGDEMMASGDVLAGNMLLHKQAKTVLANA